MAPTAKSNPIPDRYRRVTPALVVNGGVKAIEFYAISPAQHFRVVAVKLDSATARDRAKVGTRA